MVAPLRAHLSTFRTIDICLRMFSVHLVCTCLAEDAVICSVFVSSKAFSDATLSLLKTPLVAVCFEKEAAKTPCCFCMVGRLHPENMHRLTTCNNSKPESSKTCTGSNKCKTNAMSEVRA